MVKSSMGRISLGKQARVLSKRRKLRNLIPALIKRFRIIVSQNLCAYGCRIVSVHQFPAWHGMKELSKLEHCLFGFALCSPCSISLVEQRKKQFLAYRNLYQALRRYTPSGRTLSKGSAQVEVSIQAKNADPSGSRDGLNQ